jgi:hypothetical protein
MFRRALPLLVLFSIGCKNECQQLCHEMADFAEEECGKTWEKDQLKACVDDFKTSELEDADIEYCAEVSPYLREEWTCEEIGEYFD